MRKGLSEIAGDRRREKEVVNDGVMVSQRMRSASGVPHERSGRRTPCDESDGCRSLSSFG